MSLRSKTIWMDGEWIDFDDAKVHVLSHTLHYGMGAFEGIRAYEQPDGKPGIFRLEEHVRRLIESCKILQMPVEYGQEELENLCGEVLIRNDFSAAYLRPLVFIGMGAMGLGARTNPIHTAIMAWPWGAYLGEEGLAKGVNLATSTFTRHHPNAALSRAKVVGHYVNSILARYEANDNGFDEALMLDQNGFVAEGTGENVFVYRDGVIMTPPPTNILPGITRQTILEIAEHLDVPVQQTFFGRDAFYTADEAFMVGTAAEVTPIASLDRRKVGAGSRGPLTEQIQSIYLDAVRGKVDWLAHHITTFG